MTFRTRPAAVAVATAAALAAGGAAAYAAPGHAPAPHAQKHVLLLSVDGLHQSDLQWYVAHHPASALARLVDSGTSYTHARTPFPSDSFPGLVGQLTGGDPRTTGVYYDVTYNHALFPAGTTHCKGAALGAAVNFDETIDKDSTRLDAGQGLAGLPGSILNMTGHPSTLINQAALPVDPATCKPVQPNQYLEVNTVFDVLHRDKLRTAWSDKHPAYSILQGRNGNSIDDLFTPEINSDAPAGGDWTTDNASTQQYDHYKTEAVLNEINGFDHSGKHRVGTPALFGMNFQSVSTAQKLPKSDGLAGGYLPGTHTPGPLLSKALNFVDTEVGSLVTRLQKDGLASSTTVILSAKHGQSPIDPTQLTRIDDGPIIDGIDKAWAARHPQNTSLVAQSLDDDGMLLWLSDRSAAATAFVKAYLLAHPATGNTVTGGSRTLPSSGLTAAYAGAGSAAYFGVPQSDPRHPDVLGIAHQGVVYTGGTKKIAEHGGASGDDRDVPLIVASAAEKGRGRSIGSQVETTQIAPTILTVLGLNPRQLQAVDIEHMRVLPGIRHHRD
ncbi:alkaline phosphatase family protein [Allobranchiibius huperziae]|uniref:Phosphodiesterase n=1 Tax=Allobranchiibius huperziae TaxID=1874116 RepID=A0A853DJQ2_9MICO|nr:alkaline phosphatase family protein [Allobranchiibius huperziae]NYJ76263.1 hypothetical protein [Allobranchiibius huperziae]